MEEETTDLKIFSRLFDYIFNESIFLGRIESTASNIVDKSQESQRIELW